MAGADCPIPVQFCAARFARLAVDGTTPAGASNMYVMTDKLITLSQKRVYEDGDEFKVKNGCGGLALAVKAPRVLKWIEITLGVATNDPEFLELLTDGTLITVGGNSEGYADPPVGSAPGTGVSVELFRKAYVNNQQAAAKPWLWTALPKVVFSLDDDTYENGPGNISITGIGYENVNFGNGPNNDWPVGATSNRVSQFCRSAVIPTGACGYQATPVQI